MGTEQPRKPVPVPDAVSEGFWREAAAHVLAIQRCAACSWYAYPPDVICVSCLSPERQFRYEPVSGRGRLRSWTVTHDAFLPGFRADAPYVVADVELDEQAGLRMMARLVDGPGAALAVGAPVEVVFEDVAEGMAVPQFRLAGR